jgi:hypothetical protein
MMSDEISEQDDVLLPDAQVCRRYGGKSAMWIWRRERDGSGFPPAVWIGRRKHRRLSQLISWERQLAVGNHKHLGVKSENAATP